ncbi:MAG: DUF4291 domain-containing protein [Polyangiaceae bacterium]|jgi:hypothetical protein|nr:DUF4291 domain-containing protein [Polyangiaceae bacterium]
MPAAREIRADFDRDTIVVYQAYNHAIADAALARGRFAPPFSLGRMTWVKPSFLWLMGRSHWGSKSGQERTLAVRLKRSGWERALALAVPTDPLALGYPSDEAWRRSFEGAAVHVQWDTERSLQGKGLPYYSIQIGLGRAVIEEYVEEWVVSIVDESERVRKARALVTTGRADAARRLLPPEALYPLSAELARRIGATPQAEPSPSGGVRPSAEPARRGARPPASRRR